MIILIFQLLHLHGADFQRQTEQVDKAVGIVVVVEFACCEAGERLAVQ